MFLAIKWKWKFEVEITRYIYRKIVFIFAEWLALEILPHSTEI